jgi:RNA polymerase sigma factor (sigma-70 family)
MPSSTEPVAGKDLEAVLAECLKTLSTGDDRARVKILEVCNARLRELSHRLLGKFAKVRRWDDTDDVAQNAALRLYKALGEAVPDSPKGLMGLMATQIQRELLDLARKHSGPMSYAANHGTNVREGSSSGAQIVEGVADQAGQDEEIPIERWELFHQAVESLPEELREVFKLTWYLGLEREAIGKSLGMSVRTVSRRWQEARELVGQAVAATERDGESEGDRVAPG